MLFPMRYLLLSIAVLVLALFAGNSGAWKATE